MGDYISAYIVKFKLDGTLDRIVDTNIKQVYCPVCHKKMRYTECENRTSGRRIGGGGQEESDAGSGNEAVALGLEEMAGIWIISSIVMFLGGVLQVVQVLNMKYFMRKSPATDKDVVKVVRTEDVELYLDDGTAVKLQSDVVSPGRRQMDGTKQARQEIDSLTEHIDWLLERMTELEKARVFNLCICLAACARALSNLMEYLQRPLSTCIGEKACL